MIFTSKILSLIILLVLFVIVLYNKNDFLETTETFINNHNT